MHGLRVEYRKPESKFSVLHGLEASRTLVDKLLRHKITFSLEVVSTKAQGIRYILRAAEDDAPTLEQAIVSHLPDVKYRRVEDYIPDVTHPVRVLEIKQSGHFAYPLQSQGDLWEHDPMAYLTGAMTKLAPNELVAVQIVAVPTKVREAYSISKRLLHNEELIARLGKRKLPILGSIFSVINGILFAIIDGIGDTVSGPSKVYRPGSAHTQHQQQVAMKIKPARVLSPIEQKLAESVHHKLNQPLFSVNVRALVMADDREHEKQRIKGIYDWLALFKIAKYQVLKPRLALFPKQRQYRLFAFKHRLPSIFRSNTNIFSASEIADLYHFPNTETTKTENVVKSHSRTLAAPVSLKGNPQLDLILGNNHHHGTTTPIGLTAKERERHTYVVGGTGHGKTTMLEYDIVQDIQAGKGVAVIDPHGDMAEKLLGYIPESRINDVVCFNPDDLSYPIGLNMLELPEGLEGDDLLRAKDLVAESVISVFRKIFSSDDSGGHRIEYVLRNAIQTALTVENATLFTIYDLLNDPDYRKKVVGRLEDKTLKNFWLHEISKAGGMQQVKMVAGITAKVGRFLFSASAKRILEQPKSTIDFGDILNGKILICNFSKGLLGEDTSELFGIAVLAKIQVAALQRARTKQTERKPFYLYVDEFQNFATMSFVQMLSEARKYKLFLTMAEQSTSQQDDQQMVNVILANVGTIICFRTGNPMDERLLLPLFRPYIEEGEIANLPSFNFYMRISAIHAQEPFSGETIVLESESDEAIADKVIEASRKNHAIEYKPPEKPEAKEAKTKKPSVKVERKTKDELKKKGPIPKKDGLKKQSDLSVSYNNPMTLELKTTFNTATERYHARRPDYPATLFDKLIRDTKLTAASRLLEIGPGTGQATRPLAEQGYHITAVELGAELAAKAREVLADFRNVEIITGAFEDVELPKAHFDLVYSATAIHWVKPEMKFTRPHELLKPGGYLAIIHTEHVSDEAGDAFFYASKPLYKKYQGADKPINKQGDFKPPRLQDLQPPEKIDETLFTQESFTVFPMEVTYTSQEYIELLSTYSPQLAMSENKRNAFLSGIKALIDKDFGGQMTKHYGMTLTIARQK